MLTPWVARLLLSCSLEIVSLSIIAQYFKLKCSKNIICSNITLFECLYIEKDTCTSAGSSSKNEIRPVIPQNNLLNEVLFDLKEQVNTLFNQFITVLMCLVFKRLKTKDSSSQIFIYEEPLLLKLDEQIVEKSKAWQAWGVIGLEEWFSKQLIGLLLKLSRM